MQTQEQQAIGAQPQQKAFDFITHLKNETDASLVNQIFFQTNCLQFQEDSSRDFTELDDFIANVSKYIDLENYKYLNLLINRSKIKNGIFKNLKKSWQPSDNTSFKSIEEKYYKELAQEFDIEKLKALITKIDDAKSKIKYLQEGETRHNPSMFIAVCSSTVLGCGIAVIMGMALGQLAVGGIVIFGLLIAVPTLLPLTVFATVILFAAIQIGKKIAVEQNLQEINQYHDDAYAELDTLKNEYEHILAYSTQSNTEKNADFAILDAFPQKQVIDLSPDVMTIEGFTLTDVNGKLVVIYKKDSHLEKINLSDQVQQDIRKSLIQFNKNLDALNTEEISEIKEIVFFDIAMAPHRHKKDDPDFCFITKENLPKIGCPDESQLKDNCFSLVKESLHNFHYHPKTKPPKLAIIDGRLSLYTYHPWNLTTNTFDEYSSIPLENLTAFKEIQLPRQGLINLDVLILNSDEPLPKENDKKFQHITQPTLIQHQNAFFICAPSTANSTLQKLIPLSDKNNQSLRKIALPFQKIEYALYDKKNGTATKMTLTEKQQIKLQELLPNGKSPHSLSKEELLRIQIALDLKSEDISLQKKEQEIQRLQQAKKLQQLFLSVKFQGSNSTGIINIRKKCERYPNMSADTLFELIQTEVTQRSLSAGGTVSTFFYKQFRNDNVKALYDLFFEPNSNFDLKTSSDDRERLIQLLEEKPDFVDRYGVENLAVSYAVKCRA